MKKNKTNNNLALDTPVTTTTEVAFRSACDAIVTNAIDIGGGKIARIPCDLLQIADYQRKEDPRHISRLTKGWDESKCAPLTVSYRDTSFWVVDGQHRLSAAKILGKKDLKCIIQDMNYKVEAESFAGQNDYEKRVSVYSKLTALAKAGEQPYKDILTIFKNQSVPLVENTRPAPGECGCSSVVLRVRQRAGREGLLWVLNLIRDIGWSTSKNGYSGIILDALGFVYIKNIGPELGHVQNRIKSLVNGESPSMTISKAHTAHPGRGSKSALAEYFV